MTIKSDELPDARMEHMRPRETARYTGLSLSKLARLRTPKNRHAGPLFSKVSRCVIYRRSDLDAWLEANRVTTDAGG